MEGWNGWNRTLVQEALTYLKEMREPITSRLRRFHLNHRSGFLDFVAIEIELDYGTYGEKTWEPMLQSSRSRMILLL